MQLEDMRILMFSRTMTTGGTEKVILELCRALKDKVGFIGVVSCGGELVDELTTMGVPHFVIPDITDKSFRAFCTVAKGLKRIVRENDINLVHCHHRMAALYCQLTLPKTLCVVATAHNVFQGRRCATRWLYRGLDVAACGGKVYENLVSYFGLPSEKVKLIANSVPDFSGAVAPIAEVATCQKGVFKIGFVGRLSEAKGVAHLVDAMEILTGRDVPVHCYIVGDGELDARLRERVTAKSLGDSVTFLGRRDDPQNFLSQVDVCVIPSLWEGLPLVLLEAFSVGVPVVASACDGMLDVIHDGQNGLLVQPGDSAALADAIERMLVDDDLREQVGRHARSNYESDYSFDAWISKYFDFYKEALR